MLEKVKKPAVILVFILIICFSIYSTLFIVNDEIGYLGAGKVGKQVLIQSLNAVLDPNIDVDSEFIDTPFLVRLVVGEPLRTTIRFDVRGTNEVSSKDISDLLYQPHGVITDGLSGEVAMQEEYDIEASRLRDSLKEKNVKTVEEFLAGFGFKKFEIYERGVIVNSVEIRGVENVKHLGG